jgi:hypothetical protein
VTGLLRGIWLAIPILLLIGNSGCSLIRTNRAADVVVVGVIENNTYTSPRQSFRLRLPFLAPDAKLRDERPTPNTTLVTIEDKLCRQFIVSERPGFLGTQSLQSWVDENIIEDLGRLGFKIQSQALSTPNGPAIALRYRAPAAAPCNRATAVNGKPVDAKLDADVAWHVYHRDGAFYRLIYVAGIGSEAPSLWYINREPADEVLEQFAAGFEILEPKTSQKLPD